MFRFSVLRRNSNVEDIIKNYKPLPSEFDRVSRILSNSVLALVYSNTSEYLSTFGECTSYRALQEIQKKMLEDKTGKLILKEKPRIRSFCYNFDNLQTFPDWSFGKKYWDYMTTNNFNPDERPVVQNIGDIELAYIFQRYKEIHDILHVLTGRSSSYVHEVDVKWFEFQQLGLVSAGLSSLIGPIKLNWSEKVDIMTNRGPEMIKLANKSRYCMNVYFEKYFALDIEKVRAWFTDKSSKDLDIIQ